MDQNFIEQGQPVYNSEPVNPNEIYASALQEERVLNLLSQLSPENQLKDIYWYLRGYYKNPNTNQWEKQNKDLKEISPLLLSRVMGFLGSLSHQGITLSNMTETKINRTMKLIIEWYVDEMVANAHLYGLEDEYAERSRIGIIIFENCFAAFNRSLGGTESRRVFGALSIGENLSPYGQFNQQKKRGFLDSLKIWKD